MKELFKNTFSMWLNFPYKKFGHVLLWSCRLYLLILAPYLAMVFTVLLLSILLGGFLNVIDNIPSFTVAYFYNGEVLNFVAWRVYLTWFIVCILISINEIF